MPACEPAFCSITDTPARSITKPNAIILMLVRFQVSKIRSAVNSLNIYSVRILLSFDRFRIGKRYLLTLHIRKYGLEKMRTKIQTQ